MKTVLITMFLSILAASCLGQNFVHSLYDYTPNRVNPALASSNDYQSGTFLFRNQLAAEGINFTTSYTELKQPFFNEERRWCGLAVSFMNDQSNGIDVYNFNQISTSYAVSIPLAKFSELAIGLNANFQSKSLKRNQLSTASQYVEYFGFDPSLPNGENQSIVNRSYTSFAFGLQWQKLDRYGKSLFSAGYAMHNLNRAESSFNESSVDRAPFLSVLSASATLLENYQWHIKQDLILRHAGPATEVISGPSFRYAVGNMRTESVTSMIRYSTANNIMLGAVYESENFTFGGSYDLNLLKNNVSNASTFEVVLGIKRLKRPKRKSKWRNHTKDPDEEAAEEKEEEQNLTDSEDTKKIVEEEPAHYESEDEPDVIEVKTAAGMLTYLPYELEDLTYNFYFDFNDIRLSEQDQEYIRAMTEVLNQNKRVKLKLTGYTDDVGTQEYNLKLAYERAKKIGIFLLQNGVPKSKIKLISMGESNPIYTNETKDGRAKNRRVEMQLIYE